MNKKKDLSSTSPQPHHVAILVFPHCQLLDVCGPADVFGAANQLLQHEERHPNAYRVSLIGQQAGELATSAGVRIVADYGFDDAPDVDTLIVAGGFSIRDALKDAQLLTWLKQAGKRAQRLVSVCNGSFLLAETRRIRRSPVRREPCGHSGDPGLNAAAGKPVCLWVLVFEACADQIL